VSAGLPPADRLPADRLPASVLVLPACFVAETIIGGPFGLFGSGAFRYALLGSACGVLTFALLVRGRVARQQLVPILAVVGFVLLNGIWIVLVPVVTGSDYHWALREPYAFIVFVPVVLVLALLRSRELARAVPLLQRVVVMTSLVVAAVQVGLWALATLVVELRWVIRPALILIFGHGASQLTVGETPEGFFRVFWISTLWCLLSFFWIPLALPPSPFRSLGRGLLALDLLVAYTRGLWVGAAVGMVVALAVTLPRRTLGRSFLRSVGVGTAGAAALVGLLAYTGSLQQGVTRLTSTTSREDPSISARVEQAPYLLQLWAEHPFIGNGYGAYVRGYLRSDETPYSYENMPYALLAKLGLVGVLGNSIFLMGLALTGWRARHRAPAQAAAFLASGSALLFAEMTNPLVLNFVSMNIFACLLIQWASLVPASVPMENAR
jgi:O-antigen ligase/polysaccharide polymerase Wzy-like membrane protein